MKSASLGKKSSTKKSYRAKLVTRRNTWLACMKPSDPMVDTLTSVQKKMRRKLRKSKSMKKMCRM